MTDEPLNITEADIGKTFIADGLDEVILVGKLPDWHFLDWVVVYKDAPYSTAAYKTENLRRKPEKRVVWINVYPYGNDIVSRHFNTKREADRDDAQNPTTIKRVACVRVEFEEGEGL